MDTIKKIELTPEYIDGIKQWLSKNEIDEYIYKEDDDLTIEFEYLKKRKDVFYLFFSISTIISAYILSKALNTIKYFAENNRPGMTLLIIFGIVAIFLFILWFLELLYEGLILKRRTYRITRQKEKIDYYKEGYP